MEEGAALCCSWKKRKGRMMEMDELGFLILFNKRVKWRLKIVWGCRKETTEVREE